MKHFRWLNFKIKTSEATKYSKWLPSIKRSKLKNYLFTAVNNHSAEETLTDKQEK